MLPAFNPNEADFLQSRGWLLVFELEEHGLLITVLDGTRRVAYRTERFFEAQRGLSKQDLYR